MTRNNGANVKKLTKKGEVLVLKVVGPRGESHGGFIWPLDVGAVVEAPDWQPTKACGNGLHGWLWGAGYPEVAGSRVDADDSRWLVLAVAGESVIDLAGKVKFQRCRIAFAAAESGPKGRAACVSVLLVHAPLGGAPNWSNLAGGESSNLAGGVRSSLAGGVRSNLAGGYASNLAGGEASNLAGGARSNLAGGESSNLAGGARSNLAGGEASNLAGGARSNLAGGVRSNLAGGEASDLAGGYESNLAGGEVSNLAGGEASNLAGGEASNLAGGARSNLAGGARSNLAGGEASAVSTGADGLATSGKGGIVRGGTNAVLVTLYSTGPNRADYSYSIGQAGKGGILPDVWYEGSPDGLRPVPADDQRVQEFDRRSKLLAESKAQQDKRHTEGVEKSNAAPRVYLKKGEDLRAKVVPPTPPAPPMKAGA